MQERTADLQTAIDELESFSYSISHDLRGPLRAIDGFIRILEEDYGQGFDSEGQRLCQSISDNARRMGRLIDDLLALSRLGRAQMNWSTVDMTRLVQSIVDDLAPAYGAERVCFDLRPLGLVAADAVLIRQVWENLISNALKYTSPKETALIEIGVDRDSDQTIFTIQDNGVGFDMQYADKLFGVFQRLHGVSEFEGAGVGLAIAQRLVQRHGGRIWAEGEVGRGAKFSFTLSHPEPVPA